MRVGDNQRAQDGIHDGVEGAGGKGSDGEGNQANGDQSKMEVSWAISSDFAHAGVIGRIRVDWQWSA